MNQMANQIPAPGDVPLHPSLVTGDGATPPQARVEQGGVHPNSANERHTTPANIAWFFSPERYKGKQVTSEVRAGNTIKQHTTRENILAFFDHSRYRTPQKRPAPSTPSTATSSLPKAKSAKMSKQDLVDKFRLAAELNGIEWGDIAESSLQMFKKFDKFLHFGVPWFTNKFKLTV